MRIILIRHAMTPGNSMKKYIGSTDEDISKDGIEALQKLLLQEKYPKIDVLYSSSMKRCLHTCKIIYENMQINVKENLKECDFGDFENKNYEELKEDPYYIKWLESNGKGTFPGGENPDKFSKRVNEAFEEILEENSENKTVGIVCHGGTIMAILEKYEENHLYFEWNCKNGLGYICEYKNGMLEVIERL